MHYEYKSDFGYAGLYGIELANTPEEIVVEDLTLLLKNDFHVSIMAIKHLATMIPDVHYDEASEQLINAFFDFTKSHDMSGISLTHELRLVNRDERSTSGAMVHMPFLKELFQHLRSRFNVDFPTQPAHITMYTLQPNKGIGLLSEEEVKSESKAIQIPELDGLEISKQ